MEEQVNFILDLVSEKMKEAITHLDFELSKIRAGRANTSILDGVLVDYYGTPTPIANMASLSTPDARTIVIQKMIFNIDLLSVKDKNMLDGTMSTMNCNGLLFFCASILSCICLILSSDNALVLPRLEVLREPSLPSFQF